MSTHSGYVCFDPVLLEDEMFRKDISTKQLRAAGIGYKSLAKMRTGQPVQRKVARRLMLLLRLSSYEELERLFKSASRAQSRSNDTISVASWAPDGSPSRWFTTSNGLQYRLFKLFHKHLADTFGRGKLYDLAQFSDDARERMLAALERHPMVCHRLEGHSAFPRNEAVGFEPGDRDHFWVVDRFEEGETLEQYVARKYKKSGQGLPLTEVMGLMTQSAKALMAMHERNIIRRELTPASILVRPDKSLLFTDLELGKLSDEYPTVQHGQFPRSTYLAPEVGGPGINDRVDIYSWGKIFLFTLSGEPPPEVVSSHDDVFDLLPKQISTLLQNATSHSFRVRPSAAQVIGELDKWDPE